MILGLADCFSEEGDNSAMNNVMDSAASSFSTIYLCTKQLFDCKEYLRTTYALREQTDCPSVFLRNYALFLVN
jgi:hypothetical protein